MKILGLDFETTGLEFTTDRVIEVGAIVWDVEKKKPLTLYSELVLPNPFSGLSEEVKQITGIEDEELKTYGVDGNLAFEKVLGLMKNCDYIVAHNAEFDRSFFKEELKNYGLVDEFERPWIDTVTDLPIPDSIITRKLTYLAAEYGLVNPYSHRALFDTMTMLQLLSKFDFQQILERSSSPDLKVVSHVTFEEKDKAKDLGFRWDPKNRQWHKFMKECDLNGQNFPFEVTVTPM